MCFVWFWQDVKVSSPDYVSTNDAGAIDDFYKRMRHYEATYESLDETFDRDLSFIQIFNQGEKFLVNKLQGWCFVFELHCVSKNNFETV